MAKTMKKLVSFILAFAMVLAFVPAGLIDAQAEAIVWAGADNTATYSMPSLQGTSEVPLANFVDYTSATALSFGDYQIGETYPKGVIAADPVGTGLWRYGGEFSAYNNGEFYIRLHRANRRVVVIESRGQDAYFTITVKLPSVAGNYALKLENYVHEYDKRLTDAIDVYYIPEGATAAESIANDENLLSTVYGHKDNSDRGNATYSRYLTVGAFEVTEKMAGQDATFAIATSKKATITESEDESAKYWEAMRFYGLKLDGDPTAVITEAYFEDAPKTLGAKESAQLTVKATRVDGVPANMGVATVTYESSDNSIATVDENGVVTAVGDGLVTITATVDSNKVREKAYTTIFCGEPWAGADNITVYDFTKSSGNAIGSLDVYGKAGNTNWYEIAGNNVNAGVNTKYNMYSSKRAQFAANDANGLYAPVIKLPSTPGKYVLSMSYYSANWGGNDLTFYLCENNASTAGNPAAIMSAENIIAQTKRVHLGESDIPAKVANVAVITVTPDMADKEYILGLNAASSLANSSFTGTHGLILNNFTLTGAGSEVLSEVALSANNAKLDKGVPTQLNLTAEMSDGSAATGYAVSYASDNADFVVDENGVVTASADGEATITATVTLGDIIKTAEVKLTCGVIWAGNSIYYTMPAVQSGQHVAISEFVNYSSRNALTYGDKYVIGSDYPNGVIYSAPTGAGEWKYGGEAVAYRGDARYVRVNSINRRVAVYETTGQDGYFSLTLKLPETVGSYALTADFFNDVTVTADAYDVYLIPAGETAADSIANDKNLLTTVYLSAANTATGVHKDSRTYTIGQFDVTEANKGEEITLAVATSKKATVTESPKGTSEWDAMYFYGYGLKGNPTNVITEAYFENDEKAIGEGETLELDLAATMLDGSNADLTAEGVTVTYTSSDDSIATVDENGVVTQKGNGNVTITATIVDGITIEKAHIDLTCGVVWAGAENTANYFFPNLSGSVDFTQVTTKDYDFGTVFENTIANAGSIYYAGESTYSNLTLDANYRVKATEKRYENGWFAVTVELPEAVGRYALKLNTAPGVGTDAIDLYSVPAGSTAEAAITDANLIGTRFFNWDAATYEKGSTLAGIQTIYTTFGYFDVTDANKGTEQTFVIKTADKATITEAPMPDGTSFQSTFGALTFYGFKFDGAEQNSLASIELSADKTSLAIGDAANLDLTGKMVNGSDAVLTDATVTYTSSDDSIATVENGVVTALKDGVVTITATATLGTAVAKSTIELTCGVVWAGKANTANYYFPNLKSNTEETKYDIDFTTVTQGYVYDENAISSVTPSAGAMYYGGESFVSGLTLDTYARVRLSEAKGTNGWFAITVELPKVAGRYALKLNTVAGAGADAIDLYSVPAGSTAEAAITDANLIGTRFFNWDENTYEAGSTVDGAKTLYTTFGYFDVTDANKGTAQTFVIKTSDKAAITEAYKADGTLNSTFTALYFYGFKFDGEEQNSLASITLSADSTRLMNGESTDFSLTGKMVNGDDADFTDATVTYTSSDDSIATVENGKIVQKGDGSAIITATATLGSAYALSSIKVLCGDWLGAEVSEVYDFTKASGEIGTLTNCGDTNTNWYEIAGNNINAGNPENDTKYNRYSNGRAQFAADNADNLFAPVIKLPSVAGKYVLSMSYFNAAYKLDENKEPTDEISFYDGGNDLTFYLCEKNASTEGNPINIMNKANIVAQTKRVPPEVAADPAVANLAVITVTPEMAGKEYILGVNCASSLGWSSWIGTHGLMIYNFALTSEESAVLSSVALGAENANPAFGTSTQLNVTATLSDGSVTDDYTVIYESDRADITVDANGLVTASGVGDATITATVTYAGVAKAASIKISVPASDDIFPGADNTIFYSFAKTPFGGDTTADASGEKAWYYHPEDMTEENYTDGNGDTTGKMFKFHSMNTGYIRRMRNKTDVTATTQWWAYDEGDWLAVTVTLPSTPGMYTAQVNTAAWGRGSEQVAMYIIDANTSDVAKALETATPVGTADLLHIYSNNDYISTPYSFNCGTYQVTKEDAGTEKIIVLKTTVLGNREWSNGEFSGGIEGLTGVTLAGVDYTSSILESVAISSVPEDLTLEVNETAQFGTLSGTMKDGTEAVFDIVSYESSNPKAFPIDQTGLLTCKAGGTTTVKISGLANGVKKSVSYVVTCDDPTFKDVDVTVDKTTLADGETANISITNAILTDDSVVDLEAAIAAKNAYISYDFDDEIVSLNWSTRTISYVADGTTTVKVTVTYYGKPITKEFTITCGEAEEPEVPAEPEPNVKYTINTSLTLKDEILLNIMFMLENIPEGKTLEDYQDRVGVLVFDNANIEEKNATKENSDTVVSGEAVKIVWNNSAKAYVFQAELGVPAKNMGDLRSFMPYFEKADGTYSYGKIRNAYSPSVYCYNQRAKKNEVYDLVVAMLNYGAEAQTVFNYRTDDLMNKDLTAAEKTINWDDSLIRDSSFWTEAITAKESAELARNKTIVQGRKQTLQLKSALLNTFQFKVSDANVSKITSAKALVWTEEEFNSIDMFTKENASEVVDLEWNEEEKVYQYACGLPARKMFSPIYVCAVFTIDNVDYYSGVVVYCPEKWASAYKDNPDYANMAKTMLIYGHEAKEYFK